MLDANIQVVYKGPVEFACEVERLIAMYLDHGSIKVEWKRSYFHVPKDSIEEEQIYGRVHRTRKGTLICKVWKDENGIN